MPRFLTNWLMVCLLGLQGCAGPQLDYVADIAPDVPYTLAAGDRLRVIVFGQDGLSNSYSIDGSGSISMPLIGIVPVRGLTTRQLERGLEARLRNGFLREPRVSVEIEAYRPFFILGEITAAGQISLYQRYDRAKCHCRCRWLYAPGEAHRCRSHTHY